MVTILCIVVEPLYFLTRWLLQGASYPRRLELQRKGRAPMLCSLVEPCRSPVTLLLEHYSHILSGGASRLKLLVGSKYADFDDWAIGEPELLYCCNGHGVYMGGQDSITSYLSEHIWKSVEASKKRSGMFHGHPNTSLFVYPSKHFLDIR